MFSDSIAIRVEHVSKRYELYGSPRDRLKQFIVPRIRRLLRLTPRAYFQEFWALKDISFEVKRGETVGIVGRNGSGKSTLLQIICGTLEPTYGGVITHGRIAALLELGSGFNPDFTGRENVYLNASILGLQPGEIDARFDEIAAFADIGEFINHPVKTYSSGMQVRLAFAVQAMIDPDILIVDEALAVGDEKFQRKCFARLDQLKEQGASILFVSHAAPQIAELCDRAVLIEHGERLIYGAPLSVTRAYQRMIYAPVQEQNVLVDQYKSLDQVGRADLEAVEGVLLGTEFSGIDSAQRAEIGTVQVDQASFDPGLISPTSHVYPVQGAEISSIRVLDEAGKDVNVLLPACNYRIVVAGEFLSDMDGVHFGIHIRTISGAIVAGQRTPGAGEHIATVRSGKKFVISYQFKMILTPGPYFVGGGVWAEQGSHCAHRILDALMIRILPKPKQNDTSFGYVDAASAPPRLELL